MLIENIVAAVEALKSKVGPEFAADALLVDIRRRYLGSSA
jgi:hypothetical protein